MTKCDNMTKTTISDIHGEEVFGTMEMNVDEEKMKELVDNSVFAALEQLGDHQCPKCGSDDFIVMYGFKFIRTKDKVTQDITYPDSPIIICKECGGRIEPVE